MNKKERQLAGVLLLGLIGIPVSKLVARPFLTDRGALASEQDRLSEIKQDVRMNQEAIDKYQRYSRLLIDDDVSGTDDDHTQALARLNGVIATTVKRFGFATASISAPRRKTIRPPGKRDKNQPLTELSVKISGRCPSRDAMAMMIEAHRIAPLVFLNQLEMTPTSTRLSEAGPVDVEFTLETVVLPRNDELRAMAGSWHHEAEDVTDSTIALAPLKHDNYDLLLEWSPFSVPTFEVPVSQAQTPTPIRTSRIPPKRPIEAHPPRDPVYKFLGYLRGQYSSVIVRRLDVPPVGGPDYRFVGSGLADGIVELVHRQGVVLRRSTEDGEQMWFYPYGDTTEEGMPLEDANFYEAVQLAMNEMNAE